MKLNIADKNQLVQKRIETLIGQLNIRNKAECLELIVSLEPEYRMHYLNAFIFAVNALGEEAMVDLLSAA